MHLDPNLTTLYWGILLALKLDLWELKTRKGPKKILSQQVFLSNLISYWICNFERFLKQIIINGLQIEFLLLCFNLRRSHVSIISLHITDICVCALWLCLLFLCHSKPAYFIRVTCVLFLFVCTSNLSWLILISTTFVCKTVNYIHSYR